MERSEIIELVIECLHDQLEQEEVILSQPVDDSTPLIGKNAMLSSLGLVQLVLDVEQRLLLEHGIIVTLADERALSQKSSPFRTVKSLADYINQVMHE